MLSLLKLTLNRLNNTQLRLSSWSGYITYWCPSWMKTERSKKERSKERTWNWKPYIRMCNWEWKPKWTVVLTPGEGVKRSSKCIFVDFLRPAIMRSIVWVDMTFYMLESRLRIYKYCFTSALTDLQGLWFTGEIKKSVDTRKQVFPWLSLTHGIDTADSWGTKSHPFHHAHILHT